jgi:hypothetical protein
MIIKHVLGKSPENLSLFASINSDVFINGKKYKLLSIEELKEEKVGHCLDDNGEEIVFPLSIIKNAKNQ